MTFTKLKCSLADNRCVPALGWVSPRSLRLRPVSLCVNGNIARDPCHDLWCDVSLPIIVTPDTGHSWQHQALMMTNKQRYPGTDMCRCHHPRHHLCLRLKIQFKMKKLFPDAFYRRTVHGNWFNVKFWSVLKSRGRNEIKKFKDAFIFSFLNCTSELFSTWR